MTPFANFAQLDMSKIDTSPETRFPHLPLLKACFGFGFGFGSGFVGLRRWSENFDWGRMGLVYATASRRVALAPPLHHSIEQKYFRLQSIPWKLDSHPMNWTANQFIGCAFNPFGHDISIKRWNRLMEKRWHGFVTVGQFMNTVQSFDNFCQTLDIFVQCLTYWFHWGFSNLSNLPRHFLPVQILCQFSAKKFFRQKLNKINRLQKFSRGSDFGTGHAITYTEHDENHPFMGGAAGYRNKPSSGSMRQSLT